MRTLLRLPGPVLLVIVTGAVLALIARTSSTATPAPTSASAHELHREKCVVCKLPLHSLAGEPSVLGPASNPAGALR
jgi:hypothetical protein